MLVNLIKASAAFVVGHSFGYWAGDVILTLAIVVGCSCGLATAVVFLMFFNGTDHNPKGLVLVTFSTNFLFYFIITSVLVKSVVPPESHIAAVDSRDLSRWG